MSDALYKRIKSERASKTLKDAVDRRVGEWKANANTDVKFHRIGSSFTYLNVDHSTRDRRKWTDADFLCEFPQIYFKMNDGELPVEDKRVHVVFSSTVRLPSFLPLVGGWYLFLRLLPSFLPRIGGRYGFVC